MWQGTNRTLPSYFATPQMKGNIIRSFDNTRLKKVGETGIKKFLLLIVLLCSYSNALACYDKTMGEEENLENCLTIADQGDAEAQYTLGNMYSNGEGVESNVLAAEAWYLKAANHGHAAAQYALGALYEGMPETTPSNEPVFGSVVALGDLSGLAAQANLGTTFDLCLQIGDGPIEAIKWYRLAAAQGHTDAPIQLGKIYEHGRGVPQDDMLAYMWFDISTKQGRAESPGYREIVAARLSPELILEAQGLAEAWLLEYR